MTFKYIQIFLLVSHSWISNIRENQLSCLEWVTGDSNADVEWDYDVTDDGLAYHKVYRQQQLQFAETRDQADWGHWYWATHDNEGLTVQSGSDVVVRNAFVNNGKLADSKDPNFRPVNKDWPVFGFSSNLGTVTSPVNVLYTLGLAQEVAIQFDGKDGLRPLNSLWTSYFTDALEAVSSYRSSLKLV